MAPKRKAAAAAAEAAPEDPPAELAAPKRRKTSVAKPTKTTTTAKVHPFHLRSPHVSLAQEDWVLLMPVCLHPLCELRQAMKHCLVSEPYIHHDNDLKSTTVTRF